MKKVRYYALSVLFLISFFSCSEIKKSEITYKSLEGYWVSGYLLHNTELSRAISSGNKKEPKVQLLRLKNSVNGFADTSYVLKGNILSCRTKLPSLIGVDLGNRSGEFWQQFLITFISRERLILSDLRTLEEITFYNINCVPESAENFGEISFGSEILINDSGAIKRRPLESYQLVNDSTIYTKVSRNVPVNEKWRNNLNQLVSRINWNGSLFLAGATIPETEKIGEFKFVIQEGRRVDLSIKTTKHTATFRFNNLNTSDPAISLLRTEMEVFENYCHFNSLLPNYYRCGVD
ncbi:hypothetical protein BH11BAC7_BH11BAC7_02800 [soil metagenome]